MINFLSKLFGLHKNSVSLPPLFQNLDKSKLNCSSCGKLISFKKDKPLTKQNCPHCQSEYFVPYKVEDYWLTALLGSGGEGDVYKALKVDQPENAFAMKLLHKESRKEKRESLIREAQILELFEGDKHILPVFEYGYYHHQSYFVTNIVDGCELEEYITQNRPCEEECLFLAFQLLKVQKNILQRGYLYRDLKPDNILVNSDGNITLIDFGICCSANDYIEIEEEYIAGTAQYLPPERLLGEIEEERSEIYSLGLILYFMLKGEHLIQDVSKQRMAAKHLEEKNAEWIQQGLKTHSPALLEILCKMTAFHKNDRYLTIAAAENELKRYFNQSYRNVEHKTHY